MSSTTELVPTTRSATETPTVHLERMDDGTIAVLTGRKLPSQTLRLKPNARNHPPMTFDQNDTAK